MHHIKETIPGLDSLITSFQTPFWIEDKRWFVTSDYVIYLDWIRFYTTPVCIDRFYKKQLRCEISSMDTDYRLVGQMWIEKASVDVAAIKVKCAIDTSKFRRSNLKYNFC